MALSDVSLSHSDVVQVCNVHDCKEFHKMERFSLIRALLLHPSFLRQGLIVALAVLELTVQIMLASNSQRTACLTNDWIKDLHHHACSQSLFFNASNLVTGSKLIRIISTFIIMINYELCVTAGLLSQPMKDLRPSCTVPGILGWRQR